jgi:hypothetical protein
MSDLLLYGLLLLAVMFVIFALFMIDVFFDPNEWVDYNTKLEEIEDNETSVFDFEDDNLF